MRADRQAPAAAHALATGLDRAYEANATASTDVIDRLDSPAGLVAARALERPDAVALEDQHGQLSYGALLELARRVAGGLSAGRGGGRGEPVGVCLARGREAVLAFLAAALAGRPYVPLDPAQPPARLAQLVREISLREVITAPGSAEALPAGVVGLGIDALAERSTASSAAAADGERVLQLLFTSGSAGTPRAVELTRSNVLHLLCGGADVLPRAHDRVLQFAPYTFDLSTYEVWGALVAGARIVIAPAGPFDPLALAILIAERGVTVALLASGVFARLVSAGVELLGGMRLLISAGDVLAPATARAFKNAHPHVRLVNGYGPTETTVLATAYDVGAPGSTPPPIGRALPGYRDYVLDEQGRLCDEGELWIGGPGVARGYRNDPERTAERFRPDPFFAGDGARMYGTGDIVRRRSDGELLFLGRRDQQVKIDGQRIELAEVESALSAHPAVALAAAVAREDVPGHKRLVGYVTLDPAAAATADELRDHVRARLPAAMVPSAIEVLERMPLSERGKIARAELPAPRRPAAPGAFESADEALVAGVMAQVLELERVGRDESFVALGGDSLLTIDLVGRLRELTGADLDLRAVFAHPTPSGVAAQLAAARVLPAPLPPLPPLRPAGAHAGPALATFAQRRAWLFERLHPGSRAYQSSYLLRFEGELDTKALRDALGDLMRRHAALRSSFGELDGELVPRVHDELPIPLEVVDVRGSGNAWAATVRERLRRRVEPHKAPPVRWTLIRYAPLRATLVALEHHLVHDGRSFAVVVDELAELYSARVEGRPAALPEPNVTLADFALWERHVLASEAGRRQLEYWQATLDPDPPLLRFPGAQARPPVESFAGGSIRCRVTAPLCERLRGLGREEGATLFMVSLAAFAAMLRLETDAERVQIGSGVANRRDPASAALVGMVLNTVALPIDVGGNPSARELIARVRDTALAAYANADVPFDAVVERLSPPRRPDRSPLVQTLFSFHDTPRGVRRWSGLRARVLAAPPDGTTKADLNVIGIDERDGMLSFVWEHSDLISDAGAAALADAHLGLLEAFVERPDARLSEIAAGVARTSPPAPAGVAHVLRGPRTSYERDSSIVDVFRDRAGERPRAVALDFEGTRLSYAELDAASDRLARRLRALGVAPGARVGVYLLRSLECYVGLLAILKAGAVYVALDPDWPTPRLAMLAKDAAVRFVLTEDRLRARLPADLTAVAVDATDPGDDAAVELPRALAPAAAAYVAYTSGSSGVPKGVVVPHRAVVRLVRGQDYVRLDPSETLLAAAPLAFDASTFEIWGALLNGARLAIFPPEPPTPDAIDEVVRRQRVTTLWLTSGLFNRFVDLELDTLRSVRQLLTGGDVLSPSHVQRALRLMRPGTVLVNGYGPTEATTFSCCHRLAAGATLSGPIPIGRPIANTHLLLLDEAGRPVPAGVAGELWIGGDGVALGYAGQPELTAERFTSDPLVPESLARLYRSGDLARIGLDGAVEFLGRRDRQVKVRGHRVEPAEIEHALRAHPDVADVIVEAPRDASGERRLVAYVVPRRRARGDWQELRKWASAQLPAQLIPSAWVQLRELPLTANGKVDRSLLPDPGASAPGPRGLARRPARRDFLETRLIRIWEDVLGCSGVGPSDDFFELGGHSLLAVALFGEIERTLGVELPLATLFEAPTVGGLAQIIRAGGWAACWEPLVALRAAGSRPPFFCVTAGDGNAIGFGALARRLGAEQPFYALQPPGLDGRCRFPVSVEEMAERYLREVRRVAPHGPYLLGGRCLGSKVALEMAQRLQAAGEEVALLAILDDLEGPAALDLRLANGLRYSDALSLVRDRARRDGLDLGDISSPAGTAALLAYAREPVTGDGRFFVPRLLHEVWLDQPDVRAAYPDLEGDGAAGLIDWAWLYGRDLLDLPDELLPPPVAARPEARRSPRRRATAGRMATRLAESIDVAARGALPGARARRTMRLRRITRIANERYRARPYRGRITHLASQERAQELTARRWHDLALHGVEEHVLAATHRSMLRVPGVNELAACLNGCIERALANDDAVGRPRSLERHGAAA